MTMESGITVTRYDFDALTDRRAHYATKWQAVENAVNACGEPVIPLWIADMDFRTPPAVLAALQQAIEHGVLGYREWADDFLPLFCHWQAARHQWQVSPEWVVPTQSVVTALDVILRLWSQPGDDIHLFSPGFGAFDRVITQTQRRIIDVPLNENTRDYTLDIARLKASITPRSRMLILCNPHNPLGKVWRREELAAIAQCCLRHNMLLLSDDVHQDLVTGSVPYTPVAGLSDEIADRCITFTSPCKTFNFSGLPVTNLVIKHPARRAALCDALYQLRIHKPATLAMVACEAAYREGETWWQALITSLRGNRAQVVSALHSHSGIRVFDGDGGYLAWLDFRPAGLTQPDLEARLVNQAGLLLESGSHFGTGGEGFMWLNFALPASELATVLERLQRSFPR